MVSADGKQQLVKKIPGRLKWGDITLKRAITNMDFWERREMVEDGKIYGARKNGSIMMYDQGAKSPAGTSSTVAIQGQWPAVNRAQRSRRRRADHRP